MLSAVTFFFYFFHPCETELLAEDVTASIEEATSGRKLYKVMKVFQVVKDLVEIPVLSKDN